MPAKKKPAREMTTEEIAKRVFPKKVRERLDEIAHPKDVEDEPDADPFD
jgi:hypothetical protein